MSARKTEQSTVHRYTHSPELATIERFQNADRYTIYRDGHPLSGTYDSKYAAHETTGRRTRQKDEKYDYTVHYDPITRLVLTVGDERLLATLQPKSNPPSNSPPEPDDFINELLDTELQETECIINRETATTGSLELNGKTIDITYEEATQETEYDSRFYYARSTELPKWYNYLNNCDEDGWITATINTIETRTTGILFKNTKITEIGTYSPHNFYIKFGLEKQLDSNNADHLIETEIRIRAKIFSQSDPIEHNHSLEEDDSPYISSEHDRWQLDPDTLPL